jgi:hypothetical protein
MACLFLVFFLPHTSPPLLFVVKRKGGCYEERVLPLVLGREPLSRRAIRPPPAANVFLALPNLYCCLPPPPTHPLHSGGASAVGSAAQELPVAKSVTHELLVISPSPPANLAQPASTTTPVGSAVIAHHSTHTPPPLRQPPPNLPLGPTVMENSPTRKPQTLTPSPNLNPKVAPSTNRRRWRR